ncbi:hypothetical protein ERJ75_001001100 [Trypanosoma vivax]|uniref:Transmembrane protein n=1 Tax=Trypanosoma vivax (strain Y486) TaxID=1055687 RepID=G0UAX1_TRYVY|nr:hypothetical protein TRVL_00982 [Trypanosoma vivax]KAH8611311.1 hypothetical protein ERJ75_001001100 [Trypanosoma vivax]CCC52958.1 conserved hypothetical protein [Trypanosoma vivax Y486]
MEQPASLSVSAPPAPVIRRPNPVKLSYEEVHRVATFSVLEDFAMQSEHRRRSEERRARNGDVHVIPVTGTDTNGILSKGSASRLLKEHSSASWGVHMYQWSLFGLTGISSVASAMGFYLTIYHNRMFLPLGPMSALVAWRLWGALENAWEEQRFIDNAANIRESRKGNPMNLVVKRVGDRNANEVGPKDEF